MTDAMTHPILVIGAGIGGLFGRFERLFAIKPRHESRHFAHFFHEDGRVRQFAVITNSNGVNPFIHRLLCLLDCHRERWIRVEKIEKVEKG